MTGETWSDAINSVLQYQLFVVNQTPITIISLSMFLVIVVAFFLISRIIKEVLARRLLAHLKLSTGTSYTLLRLTQYTLWFVGGFVAFQFVGIDLSGVAVIFGFLSVGIGFGMQNLTSNFISGLILLFEQHIQVGDRVTVGDTEGNVVEINIRSTTIRSLNNIALIVPNSEFIQSTVTNWSHGDPKTRLEIDIGVSYDSDLDLVIQSLLAVANEHSLLLKDPEPNVWFTSFGDSAWNLQLLVWVDSPKIRRQVTSDINCAIVRKFREHNIEIPFPQRDLHVRTPALPIPVAVNG
ncbi:MAG: mechanosensitive ion channel family protein [Nitrospirales bacterium]